MTGRAPTLLPPIRLAAADAKPELLACGSNGAGQLAIGHCKDVTTFTPTIFHPSLQEELRLATIMDLASGSTHSLLLLQTFGPEGQQHTRLLGCGTNTLGQLGPQCQLWEPAGPETCWKPLDLLSGLGQGGHDEWYAAKIACSWTTTFVLYRRKGGAAGSMDEPAMTEMVVACGSNDFGELGGQMGDPGFKERCRASDLPRIIDVGLQPGETVDHLCAGQRHVVVVIGHRERETDRVVGWGANRKGELDYSTLVGGVLDPPKPLDYVGKGKAPVRAPIVPPTVIIEATDCCVDGIALGASHTVLRLADGVILAWGSNAKQQISGLYGLGDATDGPWTTWNGTYIMRIDADGDGEEDLELVSQGAYEFGQLCRPVYSGQAAGEAIPLPPDREVVDVATGSEHVLIHTHKLSDNREEGNELWVGGWNEHGNLGQGDRRSRGELTKVDLEAALKGASKRQIGGIWGGCASSFIWIKD